MQGYVYTDSCRRAYVLGYFGEKGVDKQACGACDVCLDEVVDISKAPLPHPRAVR
jgi:superfamily II DNA helicase RecQ